ncbi:hypothetical protein LTR17_001896 [Elasticomyces elasticus]|nr:hypothetical protein LTR17_001896 [Elasticomyces elasticus]
MAQTMTLPVQATNVTFDKLEQQTNGSLQGPTMFDPATHLAFEPPKDFITLRDLLLSEDKAISPVAVTAPFPLFSTEGVQALRADLFRREVVDKHAYSLTPGCYKMRGYSYDTPFVDAVWKSPAVLAACSKAAGVDLSVVFDYEIAHMNVQVDALLGQPTLSSVLPQPTPPSNTQSGGPVVEQPAIVQDDDLESLPANGTWHTDSYPWVCVVMLSDPTNMCGGETGLRKGDGTLLKVRGPAVGWAVMMQGGCVKHIALKASGGTGERITMVTSFRAKDPMQKDVSNLVNVKRSSKHNELFQQWSTYRLDVLSQRALLMRNEIAKGEKTAEEISAMMTEWQAVQADYLKTTVDEMYGPGREGSQF